MNDTDTRLRQIALFLMDVDGVLTTGQVIYDDAGQETKIFNVRDGVGIRMLMDVGVKVGIVTGRRSMALIHRCRNLGIDLIKDGVRDKSKALIEILNETGVAAENTAFVGDDLPDLPILRRVGLPIAVGDAHALVKQTAAWTTQLAGGCGAIREIAERILVARGEWESLLQRRFS
ncbi:3-deoxy-D-manno-octulosonate 8-phosphate phosphatase [Desulfosarcina cetonica]|uniref:KdsC family phosphatase n=1 Tax=Desulfosarcina cetonica TaxID=90730 RepID=UPI0006CF7DFD|nr:HAD hydrolase family protein [Desulfosarcina cetonica]VTR64751.1 3-deoxy-D-manno-octulosonate 8-phosphate phosphatase [Desulfosarcina cetonica]